MEDPVPVKEEYTYQVGKIQFIVTPVYKDKGESMRDILLKLMLADWSQTVPSTSLTRGRQRYNILGNTDCPTPEEGGHFETVGQ